MQLLLALLGDSLYLKELGIIQLCKMRPFHPENSLVVSRNLWLISVSNIWMCLYLVKHTSNKFLKLQGLQICANFFYSFSGCWVFRIFVIFHKIKVAKHIWEPCCHLVSISPTIYEQLLHQNPFAKKLQTQTVST